MKKAHYCLSFDQFGVHQRIIDWVVRGKTVLEVGCASGYLAKELGQKGCLVTGIEIDPQAAKEAEKHCQKVIIGDVESKRVRARLEGKKFEAIVLADVLEHVKDPQETLAGLTQFLKKKGKVIISVPNIGFLTHRINHLLGRFDYADWGIMDRTHLKFFTRRSILELVERAGLKVEKFDQIANFTQLPLYIQTLYPILGKKDWWRRLEHKIAGLWPEGLAIQFLLVCRKRALF